MKNQAKKITRKTVTVTITISIGVLVAVGVVASLLLFGDTIFMRPTEEEIIMEEVQEAFQSVLDSATSQDSEEDELLVQTESRNGFEVLSCSETETGCIATVRVYAPDLYTVAKSIDENLEFENEQELRKAVIEAIAQAELVEREITVECRKTENGYEPIMSMEFFDAYYGGVLKLLQETVHNQKGGTSE